MDRQRSQTTLPFRSDGEPVSPAFEDVREIVEAGVRCVARRPDAESDAARTAGLDRAARWLREQARSLRA
jgi:hypothetical protein